MKNLISCATWVARGVPAHHPKQYEVDDEELKKISTLAQINIEEARAEMEAANQAIEDYENEAANSDSEDSREETGGDGGDAPHDNDGDVDMQPDNGDEDLAEYNMAGYDDEKGVTANSIFSGVKGLSYYPDNSEDPYITLNDEDEEEAEELEIQPSDNLIVAAKTEDHVSSLVAYVYSESDDNLYVHHDILLPSFPVCLEWLDYTPSTSTDSGKTGNYVAVGTLDPDIELWSLDVIEPMFPDAILGKSGEEGEEAPPKPSPKKSKKKKKTKRSNPDCHVDSVLGLSWNKSHRNLLASASADHTVKLWDLSRELNSAAIRSFDVHTDKVQAVQWNKVEPTVLLTGSYDRTVRTFDSRSPGNGVGASLPADVEALKWDPWEGHSFYVSLENGLVLYYDARTLPSNLKTTATPRFTLQAHDGAACSVDVNPHIRGCIATGGTDSLVKVWNIKEEDGKANISLVTSRNLEVGQVFSVAWSPDDVLTLAGAGSEGKMQVWDVGTRALVRKTLEDKLPAREWKERENDGVIGLIEDNGDDSEEDED